VVNPFYVTMLGGLDLAMDKPAWAALVKVRKPACRTLGDPQSYGP
jgi:hypothetical protein